MALKTVLLVSVILQFAAAVMALRLGRVSGHRWAWLLASLAIFLLAVRRCFVLYRFVIGDPAHPPDPYGEAASSLGSVLIFIAMFAVGRLFKDLQQAETGLKDSTERYRSVISVLDEGILVRDASGCLISCNAAAGHILGIPAEKMMDSASMAAACNLVHKDGSSFRPEEDPLVAASGISQSHASVTLSLKRDGKSPIWISLTSQPLCREGEDTPYATMLSFTDITQTRQASLQLQKRLDQIQSIYRLSDAVVRAETLAAVYDEALNGMMQALRTDRAAILLFDDDGVMRFKAWRGLSDGYRRAVDGHLPWKITDVNPQPVLVPDVDADPSLAALRPVISGEGIHALAFVPLICKGTLRGKVMLYYDQPHRFDDEEICLAQTIAGHIALAIERKRMDETIRKSEARLNEAQQLAHIGSWELDIGTDTLVWSDEMYRIFEIDPGHFGASYETFLAAVHPEDREMVDKAYSDSLAGGIPCHGVHRLLFPDGRVKYVHERGETLYHADGQPLRSFGTVQDITERKQAEELIVMLKHSLDVHRDGVYWMDTDNKFVYVNKAGGEVLGYTAEELIGESILDVNLGASREAMNRVWKILRADGFFFGEAVHRRRDGSEFPVEIMTTYVQHNGREYAAGFARDITDRKKAEEELVRAKRLEVAGQLAGQIAHDFNNLLGPLIAYPELIREHVNGDPRILDMLNDMETAACRIADINQQLLTLGRRGHYNIEVIDLNTLAGMTLRTLDIPSGVVVRRELAEDSLPVRGGPAQVARILANLMTNAFDAMPGGGTLTVRTRNVLLDHSLPRYRQIRAGDYVCVDITDTGRGIPADILDRIFEPFFTTKKADRKRGSGLGLSVVHSVMADHEGYVDVQSVPGQGTTFSVYFPACATDARVLSPSDEDVPRGHGERVLVVDDDPAQLRLAEQILCRLGYQVHTVTGGEEAVAYVAGHSQDIVLLDMVMDGIDGAETLRRIKLQYPGQVALIFSGFASSERVEEAMRLGASAFIPKPVQLMAMANALRAALQSSRAMAVTTPV